MITIRRFSATDPRIVLEQGSVRMILSEDDAYQLSKGLLQVVYSEQPKVVLQQENRVYPAMLVKG